MRALACVYMLVAGAVTRLPWVTGKKGRGLCRDRDGESEAEEVIPHRAGRQTQDFMIV